MKGVSESQPQELPGILIPHTLALVKSVVTEQNRLHPVSYSGLASFPSESYAETRHVYSLLILLLLLHALHSRRLMIYCTASRGGFGRYKRAKKRATTHSAGVSQLSIPALFRAPALLAIGLL